MGNCHDDFKVSRKSLREKPGPRAYLMGPAATFPRERVLVAPRLELRADSRGMPVLEGHFAMWNTWTTIGSRRGDFLERFDPRAMDDTIANGRTAMRVMFNHGRDPQIGEKVLGEIETLEADAVGAYYRVQLFDSSFVRDLLPALAANQYGASFRFVVVREQVVTRPPKSDYNPRRLEEHTVEEARVREFGPCSWAAYPTATAGIAQTGAKSKPKGGPAWAL